MSKEITRGRGRPVETDLETTFEILEVIEGLARIQATEREAAAVLGIALGSFHIFKDRHPEAGYVWEKGKLDGLSSLRRAQYKKAVDDGNPTMLIWMGKQLLGQSDRIEQRFGETDERPLRYRLSDADLLRIAEAGIDAERGGGGGLEAQAGTAITH